MPLRPIRCATRDAATAREYVRCLWTGTTQLELGRGFTVEVSGVRGGTFGIGRISHTSTMDLAAAPAGRLQVVEVLRGAVRTTGRAGEVVLTPGQVVALGYDAPLRLVTERAGLGVVSLDMELLAEAAQVSADRLSFSQSGPLSEDWAAHWRDAVRAANRALNADPRSEAETARALATAALAAFPHEVTEVHGSEDSTGPLAVRRATAFIDAHADQPLTVGDIARHARTSVRALQQGFARHRDTSPTAYLRRVRLERAHRDLVRADPDDGVTVADVAARWGFTQPGRFAAHYREAFGMLPSETLRTRPRS